jgi:integrase
MARKRRKRPVGSITQRGASWWIRWREKGRRRSASYPDKDTAEKVLRKIIGDVAAGRGGLEVPKPPAPPLKALASDWLDRRKVTHRAHADDRSRWNVHLAPFFGHLRPEEVTTAEIRRFVEAKIAGGLSSTTTGHCVRLLSTFFTELVEQGHASGNPVGALPRSTRRLYRNAHDPRTTAFLERPADIRAVYVALAQPFATMFAIGALAGLRPGEVLALEWPDVDTDARRIHVQRQVRHGKVGPPKSGRGRLVPITATLAEALKEWKLATGGAGPLFGPENPKKGGTKDTPPRYRQLHTVHAALVAALEGCKLPALTWYQATRHTFASQWVRNGGSIEQLSNVLGHSSVTTTERYAHLRPEMLRAADLAGVEISLSRSGAAVIDLAARRAETGVGGFTVGSEQVDEVESDSVSSEVV